MGALVVIERLRPWFADVRADTGLTAVGAAALMLWVALGVIGALVVVVGDVFFTSGDGGQLAAVAGIVAGLLLVAGGGLIVALDLGFRLVGTTLRKLS